MSAASVPLLATARCCSPKLLFVHEHEFLPTRAVLLPEAIARARTWVCGERGLRLPRTPNQPLSASDYGLSRKKSCKRPSAASHCWAM